MDGWTSLSKVLAISERLNKHNVFNIIQILTDIIVIYLTHKLHFPNQWSCPPYSHLTPM